MAGRFSKQAAPYMTPTGWNTGDATLGGAISTAPSGAYASQFQQNGPGDRFIFTAMDAMAVQTEINYSGGNLYTGTYRYVGTKNNSTSIPQFGRAAFWDLLALGAGNISSNKTDATYQVTSDEAANITVALMAGVYLSAIGAGNYGFIQESGKCNVQFRGNNGTAAFSTNSVATLAIGAGAYLAAASSANANNTVGLFDQIAGANSTTVFTANSTTGYTAIDQALVRYCGPAETLPSNGNFSLIDIPLSRASYRW
jgi:hypothetical protein